jgi:hypothetical protein
MSIKQDLENRMSAIENLEHQILQEAVRFRRLKKLNELMSARDNLRLQFYNEHIYQDLEMLAMLEKEAQDYIFFITSLTTKFSKSNSEFSSHLQSILDTCEQGNFFKSNNIITLSNNALGLISLKTRETKNIMTNYRLRNIQRCKMILNQYSQENIENKARSVDCCTDLHKEEMGE